MIFQFIEGKIRLGKNSERFCWESDELEPGQSYSSPDFSKFKHRLRQLLISPSQLSNRGTEVVQTKPLDQMPYNELVKLLSRPYMLIGTRFPDQKPKTPSEYVVFSIYGQHLPAGTKEKPIECSIGDICDILDEEKMSQEDVIFSNGEVFIKTAPPMGRTRYLYRKSYAWKSEESKIFDKDRLAVIDYPVSGIQKKYRAYILDAVVKQEARRRAVNLS
jgi:hypothetical protein